MTNVCFILRNNAIFGSDCTVRLKRILSECTYRNDKFLKTRMYDISFYLDCHIAA